MTARNILHFPPCYGKPIPAQVMPLRKRTCRQARRIPSIRVGPDRTRVLTGIALGVVAEVSWQAEDRTSLAGVDGQDEDVDLVGLDRIEVVISGTLPPERWSRKGAKDQKHVFAAWACWQCKAF